MEASLLKAAFILAAAGVLLVLTVSPVRIMTKLFKSVAESKTHAKKVL